MRKKAKSSIQEWERYPHRKYCSAVSSHSHTHYSRDSLSFLPKYVNSIPILSSLFRRASERHRRNYGKALDFSCLYWSPVLSPQSVYDSEKALIEKRLGLLALISLTDHDNTEAGKSIRFQDPHFPLSLEWSVPFGASLFHLGIHNLPQENVAQWEKEMLSYTFDPNRRNLPEILKTISESETTLVVWNHPCWDQRSIGPILFGKLQEQFAKQFRPWIHAIEINGYRTWRENQRAIALAERWNLPLLSGGDRHGFAHNSLLNLAHESSFADFIRDLRESQRSEVLILPEYRQPLWLRMMETLADAYGYHAHLPIGRQKWTDRIFVELEKGQILPLSYYWKKSGPLWLSGAMRVLSLLGSRQLRPAFRLSPVRE